MAKNMYGKRPAKKQPAKKIAAKKSATKKGYGQKRKKKDDDCFITTACVNYFGLGDQCSELRTLRSFRDSYMLTDAKRKQFVIQYYVMAPRIVELLNETENKEQRYADVFKSIRKACRAIDKGNYETAQRIYCDAVAQLCVQLKLM